MPSFHIYTNPLSKRPPPPYQLISTPQVCVQSDLLPTSPLADLMHMTPRDLWPNADMFLKMKKKEAEREMQLKKQAQA